MVTGLTFPLDCEIPGTPSASEEIQAINSLLPAAITFLALVWSAKRLFEVLWISAISRPGKSGEPD